MKKVDKIQEKDEIRGSCRYCPSKPGVYKVTITGLNEVYYLCEDHYRKEPEDKVLDERLKKVRR